MIEPTRTKKPHTATYVRIIEKTNKTITINFLYSFSFATIIKIPTAIVNNNVMKTNVYILLLVP